jgi:hypothetical protein
LRCYSRSSKHAVHRSDADAGREFDPRAESHGYAAAHRERRAQRHPGVFRAAAPIPTLEEGVVEFDVDLVGSGTAGTAPAWGPLIQACAFAEVIVASTSVTYNPVSSGLQDDHDLLLRRRRR